MLRDVISPVPENKKLIIRIIDDPNVSGFFVSDTQQGPADLDLLGEDEYEPLYSVSEFLSWYYSSEMRAARKAVERRIADLLAAVDAGVAKTREKAQSRHRSRLKKRVAAKAKAEDARLRAVAEGEDALRSILADCTSRHLLRRREASQARQVCLILSA